MGASQPTDAVLSALDELIMVLRETTERNRTAIQRAEAIRRLRRRGRPYSEIGPMEQRPLIVELLTRNLSELSEAGSRLRRVEAQALYSEGLTMAEIADLFGVTRQRVAALLHPGGPTNGRSIEGKPRRSSLSDPERRARCEVGHRFRLRAIPIDKLILGP